MFADYEASFIHQCYFQPHNVWDTNFFSFEAFDTVILVKGQQPLMVLILQRKIISRNPTAYCLICRGQEPR